MIVTRENETAFVDRIQLGPLRKKAFLASLKRDVDVCFFTSNMEYTKIQR